MIPWTLLASAPVDGTGNQLRLLRRGAEFSIRLGTAELMNSRVGGSEAALGRIPCERLRHLPAPRILIGGLGMGFTLRAALAELGPDARITVAEVVPAVVAWGRGPMAEIFAGSLDDPRVTVIEADVAVPIARPRAWDAILLDVDNGPAGLTREANDDLYSGRGIAAVKASLRPGGILAVWSATPDEAFARRLRTAGFAVEELKVREREGGKGARHVIWLATP